MSAPRILIIAGSDSGGGAGLQADIKTVTMFGGHAMTAVTAITAQDTTGVGSVLMVPADLIVEQIDRVVADLGVDAVKIGMIGSVAAAEAVAARLESVAVPVVFDPVMVATSGAFLADAATIAVFARLGRLATVTTPNLPELETLAQGPIAGAGDLEAAALSLARAWGRDILAKGGHLPGDVVTDILALADGTATRFESARIDSRHTHGTGCTLASAIACELARGRGLADAVASARAYVQAAIRCAPGFGAGHGPMGHALGAEPWRRVVADRG
jgi:hydroxymethylpyrimidine/phosphomethylpyrimidine kinase